MSEIETRGAETPTEDSLEIMKELGMVEETPKEEVKKELPIEEPKPEETPKEEKAEDPKGESEEEPHHEEKGKERKPREMPIWKHEVEKKQLLKRAEEESKLLREELNKFKSEFDEYKRVGSRTEIADKKEEITDKLSDLAKKYDIDDSFIKDFTREILQSIPKPQQTDYSEDIKDKLKAVEELREESRKKQEDYEFQTSFQKTIIPKIREEYPNASEEDIGRVKNEIQKHYFNEKYITLDIDEIYSLKKADVSSFLPSQKKNPAEKGTRGVSRGEKAIDYESITEEQYAKMSSEDQEKVEAFLIQRERSRR
jgi:hypothetical protein